MEKYCVGVFLKFSEAFNSVDYAIPLSKLYHYDRRGSAVSRFNSNLCNRKQYVSYDNTTSTIRTISCGVLQVSIWGPCCVYLI